MDPTKAVPKGLLKLKEALGRDSHVTKTFQARLAYIVKNAVVGMIRLISLTLLFSGRTVPTLCLLEILMCASGNIFYDGPSPTMDILRAYLESGSSGLAMDPRVKVDLVAFELIPFCSKLLRSDKSFVAAGDDGVCLPLNPNHPTYSVESLKHSRRRTFTSSSGASGLPSSPGMGVWCLMCWEWSRELLRACPWSWRSESSAPTS